MFRRVSVALLILMAALSTGSVLQAENRVLAELRFAPAGDAERKAGVWVDGQYLGYVNELTGDKKVLLLPGKHDIVVRQAWYNDYVDQLLLQPGEVRQIKLAMIKKTQPANSRETAELKIAASPERAVVFVDDQFAGHVDEFNGVGHAMLISPGQHHVRIALPGYLPFDTVVNLRPHQKLKIQTALEKGSITEAGKLVSR